MNGYELRQHITDIMKMENVSVVDKTMAFIHAFEWLVNQPNDNVVSEYYSEFDEETAQIFISSTDASLIMSELNSRNLIERMTARWPEASTSKGSDRLPTEEPVYMNAQPRRPHYDRGHRHK